MTFSSTDISYCLHQAKVEEQFDPYRDSTAYPTEPIPNESDFEYVIVPSNIKYIRNKETRYISLNSVVAARAPKINFEKLLDDNYFNELSNYVSKKFNDAFIAKIVGSGQTKGLYLHPYIIPLIECYLYPAILESHVDN